MQEIDSPEPKPVTFRFQNIGPVTDAEFELGGLTIIAGRNNTGKTYLVYTLYGFLKMWKDWPYAVEFMLNQDESQFLDMRSIANKVIREGQAILPIDRNQLAHQRQLLIKEIAGAFSRQALPVMFSSQHGDFEDSAIEVEFNGIVRDAPHPFRVDLPDGGSLSIEYDENNVVIAIKDVKKETRIVDFESYISYRFFLFLLRDRFPEPFILSAERFGISLFYRELDFTKNQLVDLLQKMGDDKSRERISPFLVIDRATSRYALPIKDNIDYTRSIPDRRKDKSDFTERKLFDDIKDMMDGYYGASGDGIQFMSKARGKGRSFNIPLHLASSSVRGFSDLYFFLRHVAGKDHLLIIDEPESHLDTANQIQLARLLARCVRAGLRVLITTHSDYLIKEINNLVMLSHSFAGKESVVKKLKYTQDDALAPDSIRAYVAENHGLTRCEVDRFGIDMPVFDSAIDGINTIANELASLLEQEEGA